MDIAVSKALQDKLYDKRKAGALELEALIRSCLADNNHDRIAKIVHQLCHDYAYAVHQPHARNGGLIGLAAAAIALGSEVARYLQEIVPPVLACFSDQDARVRYYACESMYNIAKVAKGEILLYFNDVFDALCKLAADSELSVKNGAELLDRLVKDIVSESAATYASIIVDSSSIEHGSESGHEPETAFSLPKFIPLLQERIHVLNPFTRSFLTSWITLLDSIPDLELVAYLPSFLGGLLKYLTDTNIDVHTTTKQALDKFLSEIRKISAVKKGIAESKKGKDAGRRRSGSSTAIDSPDVDVPKVELKSADDAEVDNAEADDAPAYDATHPDSASSVSAALENGSDLDDPEDEWIPGQDVQIEFQKILDILVTFLSESRNEEIQLTTLKWIEAFLDICPEDILLFTPRLLAQVLPALSSDGELVKQAAGRVNQALMNYVVSLPEEPSKQPEITEQTASAPSGSAPVAPSNGPGRLREATTNLDGRRESTPALRPTRKPPSPEPAEPLPRTPDSRTPEPPAETASIASKAYIDFDYEAAVNALTLQFLHEHEATRVAALAWLIMLHRKSPRRILAIHDGTFPALLKTLSDPAEAVVTRDLLLLSQISKNSDDSYFTSFMVNLLKLFCTDRRLLETRGNLIVRQLCTSLSAERIYRTMADILSSSSDPSTANPSPDPEIDDIEFASIMVQNLNNNLITAPELSELRKRLRNLDSSKDAQTFFTTLFRAWCVNAVATFSLCLLAQAYEQAYELLKLFAEMEMTVTTLIQIDKLVQLLESPVFTYLRMQLLEPERYPHLYKCLYGLLMLLPQSSAFAALKNRLNSVSAIGYLHIPNRGAAVPTTPSSVSTFERQNRLKAREDGGIRWTELLEKFRTTQERLRKAQQRALNPHAELEEAGSPESVKVAVERRPASAASGRGVGQAQQGAKDQGMINGQAGLRNARTGGLAQFGRFAGGVGKGKAKGGK
ncbi:hypothetical protein B0A48_14591 [Cryoendolithus antarcticus]|uniref:Vacuolar protein 14 C-terminal Fig4-binding domain-containing protein n=1 Tax=Cryoendolithus antarcticus TaxID=1507870 RepID=A0A1V8SLS0_9PEZI|nr:hypothetical protein B0A48_14591 [Cryoendolithus antarcticus]